MDQINLRHIMQQPAAGAAELKRMHITLMAESVMATTVAMGERAMTMSR